MPRGQKKINGQQFFIVGCSTAMAFFILYTITSKFQRAENETMQQREPDVNYFEQMDTMGKQVPHFNETLSPPGVIYRMKGGIGNQLFQYACSYALARRYNWTLFTYYISSAEPVRVFKEFNREFVLDYFQVPVLDIIDNTTKFEETYPSDEDLLEPDFSPQQNKFARQTGYCQSIEYFKNYTEDIKKIFHPRLQLLNHTKLQNFVNRIKSTESVAVHVRRGDFVGITGFFIPISYQRLAIRKMVKLLKTRQNQVPTFFVFSDDITHTKKKLKDFEDKFEFVYVSEAGNTSIEDFYLMLLCKHNIIPNSTFSWWAAYINENPDKIVISSAFNPEFWKLWEKDPHWKNFYMKLHGTLYHPLDWVIIDPFSGGM